MQNEHDRPRILAVEDQQPIRVLLQYMLRSRFELEVAASYEEALRRAKQQRFDLFLLDINLGAWEQRTGVDLLGALRLTPAHRATPAVTCTAFDMPGDRERFLACGFNAHIGKPFTREQLLKTLDAVLAAETRPASSTHGSSRTAA